MLGASTSSLCSAALLALAACARSSSASPLFHEGALSFLSHNSTATNGSVAGPAPTDAGTTAGIPSTNNNGPRWQSNATNPYIENGMVPIVQTCTERGTFSISFDDGTQPPQEAITQIFEQHDARTTYFVNGRNFRCLYDPAMVDILRRTYAAGHQIGSHGWSHVYGSRISEEEFERQIRLVDEALEKILGIRPAHYRPPFGDYDEDNLRVLASRNYSVVPLWDLVAGSGTGTSIPLTQQRYAEAAATYPTPHMALSHEQDVSAADYLPGVVEQLTQAGYRLVTVAECIGVPAYQWVGEPQERDETWTCSDKPGPGQASRKRRLTA